MDLDWGYGQLIGSSNMLWDVYMATLLGYQSLILSMDFKNVARVLDQKRERWYLCIMKTHWSRMVKLIQALHRMETHSFSQDYASRPATAWQTVIRIKRIIGICTPFIAPKTMVVRSSHSQILSITSWMKPAYVDFDDAGMLLDPMGKEAYGQPYDELPVRWPV